METDLKIARKSAPKLLPVYAGGVPLGRYSAVRTAFSLLFKRRTFAAAMSFVGAVVLNFFVIQHKRRLGLSKVPVIFVDHPLDAKIPFSPPKVRIYMDFVGFFLRISAMLLSRLEKGRAVQACAEYLDFVGRLYKTGGEIYSRCMTTTDRPHYKRSPKFLMIHIFDPHLLCAPSLHVAIAAGSFAFVRKVLAPEDSSMPLEEKSAALSEVYSGAAAIIESVLFVKQHSVNCVACAFYMLTAAHERGFFTAEDAADFADALFFRGGCVSEADKTEIRSYLLDLYESLCGEFSASEDSGWQAPLFHWLQKYAAETGQSDAAARLAED